MSVIVHPNENIDNALKRLQREVIREKVLEEYKKRAYRIKESDLEIEKRKAYKKTKTRRARARRKAKN